MIPFKHILVPVDFSEASDRALRMAIELAKEHGVALTVLHVFDVPTAYTGMGISPMDLLAPMREAAQKQLDGTLVDVRGEIPSATVIMDQGVPWQRILNAIEQRRADLVVMGTRGRRGLGRALLGSVAEKIVRLSPVPVLTVRAEADEAASSTLV